jgi:hypothetical protein
MPVFPFAQVQVTGHPVQGDTVGRTSKPFRCIVLARIVDQDTIWAQCFVV